MDKGTNLTSNGNFIIAASEDNPVLGTVTHYAYKQVGRNRVEMCSFHPDVAPDKNWIFSRKWLRKVKNKKNEQY